VAALQGFVQSYECHLGYVANNSKGNGAQATTREDVQAWHVFTCHPTCHKPVQVAAHADEASKQQPAASGPAVYYAEPSGPALTQEQQEKLWSAPASTFRLNNEVLRGNNQEDLA
jgi:hypothetical protein